MAVTTIDDAARVAAAARILNALPEAGVDSDRVRATLDELALDDLDWRNGRGFSLVYDSPEAHHRLVREVATRFIDENALSHSAFPSAARFEAGVLAMVASVLAPATKAYGIFASGATESTMVALKAYRDHARHQGANVVVPATAHPAFGKAAEYLDIDLVRVPVGPSGVADPEMVLDAVDGGTIAIGLSAPCYPFGTVDPIADIAAGAHRGGVPVHVDAALGGLFLPFVDGALGIGLDVRGVTSVAVDLHKYGYGVKGASGAAVRATRVAARRVPHRHRLARGCLRRVGRAREPLGRSGRGCVRSNGGAWAQRLCRGRARRDGHNAAFAGGPRRARLRRRRRAADERVRRYFQHALGSVGGGGVAATGLARSTCSRRPTRCTSWCSRATGMWSTPSSTTRRGRSSSRASTARRARRTA